MMFQLYRPPPACFLQRFDIPCRVHVVPLHNITFTVYSLLQCILHPLTFRVNLHPVCNLQFYWQSQHGSHNCKFCILLLIYMTLYFTLEAYLMHTIFNKRHPYNYLIIIIKNHFMSLSSTRAPLSRATFNFRKCALSESALCYLILSCTMLRINNDKLSSVVLILNKNQW